MQNKQSNVKMIIRRLTLSAAAVLAVSAPLSATSAQAATYSVIGTEGRGLYVRTAPSLSAASVTLLGEGTPINIVCQTQGDSVMGSTMWDKIEGPATGYLADYYTTTPVFNGPTPGLPSCEAPPPQNQQQPQPQPPTLTQPRGICTTQTAALTGWKVYKVCLSSIVSSNGSTVSGHVTSVSCSVFAPTGSALGYYCDRHARSWGDYWNAKLGAWEDWYNQRVGRIPPYPPYGQAFVNCVYLRVDTYPNGHTTYQNFTNANRNFWTTKC